MAENKKKVLVFGNGQLGYDLIRVLKNDFEVVALDRQAVDVTDKQAVISAVKQANPVFVINATAYNKVEQAESERDLAFQINSQAVCNLGEAAKLVDAIFVHVSTDYVFDGSRDFFKESDEPNPLNAYGASKLEGESKLKDIGGKFYLIRTSSVFGVKQSGQKMNFVDKIISLAKEGKPLKVVADQIMSPTYSLDLANKIKEIMEKLPAFGIYHITNQGSCSWYEFAKEILENMGLKANLDKITAAESGSKVIRPKISVLKNTALLSAGINLLPSWQDAVGRYLKEKYGPR